MGFVTGSCLNFKADCYKTPAEQPFCGCFLSSEFCVPIQFGTLVLVATLVYLAALRLACAGVQTTPCAAMLCVLFAALTGTHFFVGYELFFHILPPAGMPVFLRFACLEVVNRLYDLFNCAGITDVVDDIFHILVRHRAFVKST